MRVRVSYVVVLFKLHLGMDSELYDEFGNYIGPELESDESDEGEEQGRDDMPVLLLHTRSYIVYEYVMSSMVMWLVCP